MTTRKPTKRKRRTRLKPDDRRRDLVEATISILADKGYTGFTLADVAKVVGVSPSLILLHFGSKSGLLNEVMRYMAEKSFNTLHESQSGANSPAERLWNLVNGEFTADYFTPRYLEAWKTFWVALNGRKAYLKIFGEQTRQMTELTKQLCAELIETGGYSNYEPWVAGRLIDTALGGIWIDLTSGPTPLSIPEARHMARSLLAMFFPRHFTIEGPIS